MSSITSLTEPIKNKGGKKGLRDFLLLLLEGRGERFSQLVNGNFQLFLLYPWRNEGTVYRQQTACLSTTHWLPQGKGGGKWILSYTEVSSNLHVCLEDRGGRS